MRFLERRATFGARKAASAALTNTFAGPGGPTAAPALFLDDRHFPLFLSTVWGGVQKGFWPPVIGSPVHVKTLENKARSAISGC